MGVEYLLCVQCETFVCVYCRAYVCMNVHVAGGGAFRDVGLQDETAECVRVCLSLCACVHGAELVFV